MKKSLILLLSALITAGMAVTASAWEENVDYVSFGEITAANYPGSTAEGWPAPANGTLLKGTIIAGLIGGETCSEGHAAVDAFDGSGVTFWTGLDTDQRSFVGMIFDQAYELTEIRVRPSDEMPTDRLHGLTVEGSNDGIHWARIVEMRQDAHGKDYHILTPQTVTDPAYLANGYAARTDESPFWIGNGGSYKMYRVWSLGCMPSFGDIEFYGVAKEATVLDDRAAADMIPTTTWFPGNINVRDYTLVKDKESGSIVAQPLTASTVDGSIPGTVIGAGGSWNKAFYENAFDGGDNKKAFDPCFRGEHCWVGLKTDEPYALTSVKVRPKRGAYKNLEGCLIQGSLDGRTWVTLTQFTAEDVPEKQDWVEKTITDVGGYTYFRYITNVLSHGDVADISFYGAPAAAATNIPAAEKYPVATYATFEGDLIYTGIRAASVEGSLSGEVFGYGTIWFLNKEGDKNYESLFDNNPATMVDFEKAGALVFAGIKLDAPTVITEVRLLPGTQSHDLNNISGAHVQGSVDGINWVDLATFGDADIPAAQAWVTAAVTDTTAYNYVRYAPSEYAGDPMAEALFFGTVAEVTAPETAAPETAAPETTAPSTGTDTPVAPQTFDAGVIAAVAAVVSAAGYAITKKRK